MKGFPYRTNDEIRAAAEGLGLALPWSDDLSILSKEVKGENYTLPNALCAQPMEGNDSDEGGAPTKLTTRRYEKIARGGSGLIWVEAVAVSQPARANPRQLMLTRDNMDAYRKLADDTRKAAADAGWARPLIIMQLTHSGRNTTQTRIAASAHKVMNPHQNLPMDYPIITDEELKATQTMFAQAAVMAREAGFDGVDIKCCHLYLLSELLGAKNRPGPYGGDWAGRSRMQIETTKAITDACGKDFVYAVRLNACDAMDGGFGTDEHLEPVLTEAMDLCRIMRDMGVTLFNVTMGTPYYNPHVNRPYASHPKGEGYDQPENPLRGVMRMLNGCKTIQSAMPDSVFVSTGYSYLRQFAPQVAAGLMLEGGCKVAGVGREWLAYPDYANDILKGEGMVSKKCCVTCGYCTYLMRRGLPVGCPIKDEDYKPYLKEAQAREAAKK